MTGVLPYLFAIYPVLAGLMVFSYQLRCRTNSFAFWLLCSLASSSVVVFMYLTAPWAFSSYYLRDGMISIFVFIVMLSFWKFLRADSACGSGKSIAVPFLLAICFTLVNAAVLSERLWFSSAANLTFPLKNGDYVILQGGSNPLSNPFHSLGGQKYAVDIVQLNRFGNRAKRIASPDLLDYRIFGGRVYSPCDGWVDALENQRPDTIPGQPDLQHQPGNYVRLNCGGRMVLLAHLRQGSVVVSLDERVFSGQLIAEVGNSGNSLEPHLHVDVADNGMELAISFDGRPALINTLFSVNGK